MDTFSITCTTCNSRLRVQSLSAIGQILACPKCQSMVKVEPPEGWIPPEDQHVLDEVETRRTPESLVSESTIHRHSPPVDNTFDDAADLLAGKKVPAGKSENAEPPRTNQEPHKSNDAPLLPNADWTSGSSRKKLAIASAIAVALLLGTGVIAIGRALLFDDNETEVVAANGAETSEPIEEERNDAPAPVSDVKPPQTPNDSDDKDKTSDVRNNQPKVVGNDGNDAPEVIEPSPITPPPKDPVDKVDEGSPETPVGPPGLVAKGKSEPADDTEFTGPSLLAELDKFSELIDDPEIAVGATDTREFADLLEPAEVPEEGPGLPRPASRDVDVSARLDDPLQGIEFTDVPLASFIQFVSDFSTIPISLDPHALTQRQITPQAPVSIRRAETTVEEVLRDGLSSHGLDYVQRDEQLVVVAGSPEPGSLRSVEYDLSDLSTDSEDDAKLIADWITAVVVPKSWRVNGGSGVLDLKGSSLTIQQSESIHFQVLMFCEKLRVARGLSPRSSFPADLFRLEPRAEKIGDRLERPVSMNYLDAARFVDMLQRAQQQSGVNILVDWHALAESGWNPDARFPYSIDKKPLREMLSRLLGRMELTYRVVDTNTVQVSTDKRLMNLAEIEFYRADDLLTDDMTAEQLAEGVISTIGEVHFFGHAGAIRFDPKSRHLIVAIPQPQQQMVARILSGLRKRGSKSAE